MKFSLDFKIRPVILCNLDKHMERNTSQRVLCSRLDLETLETSHTDTSTSTRIEDTWAARRSKARELRPKNTWTHSSINTICINFNELLLKYFISLLPVWSVEIAGNRSSLQQLYALYRQIRFRYRLLRWPDYMTGHLPINLNSSANIERFNPHGW